MTNDFVYGVPDNAYHEYCKQAARSFYDSLTPLPLLPLHPPAPALHPFFCYEMEYLHRNQQIRRRRVLCKCGD